MRRTISVVAIMVMTMGALFLTDGVVYGQTESGFGDAYPGSAMYLTYMPLGDIARVLQDTKEGPQLAALTDATGLDLMRQFLVKNRGSNIGESLAFLQLDLVRFKAGYKKASDTGLTITEAGWNATQVKAVARVCHAFATQLGGAYQLRTTLKQGRIDLPSGWSKIKAIETNIFIPAERRAELVHDFLGLVETKSDELAAVKRQHPKTYEEITNYKALYQGRRSEFETPLVTNQLPVMKTREEVDNYLGSTRQGWDRFLDAYDNAVTRDFRAVTN